MIDNEYQYQRQNLMLTTVRKDDEKGLNAPTTQCGHESCRFNIIPVSLDYVGVECCRSCKICFHADAMHPNCWDNFLSKNDIKVGGNCFISRNCNGKIMSIKHENRESTMQTNDNNNNNNNSSGVFLWSFFSNTEK